MDDNAQTYIHSSEICYNPNQNQAKPILHSVMGNLVETRRWDPRNVTLWTNIFFLNKGTVYLLVSPLQFHSEE